MPQCGATDFRIAYCAGIFLEVLETLLRPDERTVLTPQARLLTATRKLLNQDFERRRLPSAMRIELSYVTIRANETVRYKAGQIHLCLIFGHKRPERPSFPNRCVPFVTHREKPATAEVGLLWLVPTVEKSRFIAPV